MADNRNSLTGGERGPLRVQEWQLLEKHAHFNCERIPERVVHAEHADRYDQCRGDNDYSRLKFASLDRPDERQWLFQNIVNAMKIVPSDKADNGVAQGLAVPGRSMC